MNRKDKKPLVSAIIPTKNRVDLLPRALGSVFNQTYSNIEIIIVDDSSTDATPQWLANKKRQSPWPMKIITNDRSTGAAQARNQAIEAANGHFVAGLDDDDEWHTERIRALVSAYDDEYAFVTSDVMMAFPGRTFRWKKKSRLDLDTLLYTNQVGNQGLIARKRLLEIGGFDPHLEAAQDYDLWIRLCAAFGPVKNIQRPLQTVHMDHQSERITDRSWQGYLQFYQKHRPRMNRAQRQYQLYKIRRAQGKPESIGEFINWIPAFRYAKEMKLLLMRRFSA